jgi:hypothetical protein
LSQSRRDVTMDNTQLEHRKIWSLRQLPETEEAPVPAWEMVEAGRYMPRRIRGSYRGRELG